MVFDEAIDGAFLFRAPTATERRSEATILPALLEREMPDADQEVEVLARPVRGSAVGNGKVGSHCIGQRDRSGDLIRALPGCNGWNRASHYTEDKNPVLSHAYLSSGTKRCR